MVLKNVRKCQFPCFVVALIKGTETLLALPATFSQLHYWPRLCSHEHGRGSCHLLNRIVGHVGHNCQLSLAGSLPCLISHISFHQRTTKKTLGREPVTFCEPNTCSPTQLWSRGIGTRATIPSFHTDHRLLNEACVSRGRDGGEVTDVLQE